jgi:5-methylthioadenosine/S-adenosylhomocysteine deaminase
MLRQGVRIGFGTDSPASSNISDMFDEMRMALFLHRAVEKDVSVLTAQRCVYIATLGAAEALGMAHQIGSFEAGKFADLIAVDVSRSHFAPIEDPYSALVYGANQDDVTFACVGGRVIYRDRELLSLDADAVRAGGIGVREKLQAKVREGVRVGAEESGWWHTTVDGRSSVAAAPGGDHSKG